MECSEVRKKLAAYIEKAVSPKQKALIAAHLKGCKRCKGALVDLKKAVEYVQKLEEVEPPAWVAQKVMTQVRSEAEAKGGIWQWLFSPFYIKIPLEALALVLVVVGTIYIFKAMQPEMQLAQAPTETTETAPPARAPGKGEVHDVTEDKRPITVREERLRYAEKEKAEEQKTVGLTKAPAEEAKREEAAQTTGVAPADELKREGAPSSVAFEKGLRSEQKAEGVILIVNVSDLENANRDIEGTIQQLGGRIIKQESIGDKSIINAEIDSKQMTELFNQLNLIGEVQEQSAALEAEKGDVGVQIELEKKAR
jgi:hypothetical protein